MSITTSAQSILLEEGTHTAEQDRAFWALIERYRSDLINQAFSILRNLQDAEDVAQATFSEVYRNPSKLVEVQSIGAWLRSINRTNALDRLRTQQRQSRKANDPDMKRAKRQMTTGGFSQLERQEMVATAIESLSEELREVTVLYYWEHLGQEEIARRLQLSERTVWQRLHDAHLNLHQNLAHLFVANEMSPERKRDR